MAFSNIFKPAVCFRDRQRCASLPPLLWESNPHHSAASLLPMRPWQHSRRGESRVRGAGGGWVGCSRRNVWAWLPLRPADSREKRDYSQSASPPPVAQRGARTAETLIPDRRRVQARRQSHGEGDENRPGSSSDERHAAFVERDIIISLSLFFFSLFFKKRKVRAPHRCGMGQEQDTRDIPKTGAGKLRSSCALAPVSQFIFHSAFSFIIIFFF